MQEDPKTEPWITSVDQVSTANDSSLRQCLLTLDGRGPVIKASALDELIRRAAKPSEGLVVCLDCGRQLSGPGVPIYTECWRV